MAYPDLPAAPAGYTIQWATAPDGSHYLFLTTIPAAGGGGGGTVTTVSVVTANGVSGSVANPTTTPAITLALGAIAPSSVAATGNVTGANLSGTNTGDQTSVSGNAGTATALQTARTINGVSFNGTANITIPTGALTQLAQVVTAASQATVQFSSISGSYNTLRIVYFARCSAGIDVAGLFMKINSDATAANYDKNCFVRNTGTGTDSPTTAGAVVGVTTGTSSDANGISGGEIIIPGYATTSWFKVVFSTSFAACATTIVGSESARWRSANAINDLVFSLASGNFVDGSVFTLYGVN